MKRTASISSILRPLSQAPTQAYISNAIQVADILEWILSKNLPPDADKVIVRQTTFSISEEFLRRSYFIRKKFNAKFVVIIDRKALNKIISLWKFISQVYDEVYISDNHSKILLVSDAEGSAISLVTSQNLTRGNRAESAVISADAAIFNSLLECFEDLRKFNSAPFSPGF